MKVAIPLFSTSWQWVQHNISELPLAYIRHILNGVCIVAILYWGTQASWLLLSPPSYTIPNAVSLPISDSGVQRIAVDSKAIASWNLFGKRESIAPQTPLLSKLESDAALTKLDIVILGIAHVKDPQRARVVMRYNNAEYQHQIGDRLAIGSNVTVERILVNQVIIRNQGRYETIRLYEENDSLEIQHTPSQLSIAPPGIIDHRQNPTAIQAANTMRHDLLNDPTSILKSARITPVTTAGSLSGFKIDAQHDARLATLGFQPGDVITAVNGINLDNPGKTLQIYQMLRSEKEGHFTILRNGIPTTIIVPLAQ